MLLLAAALLEALCGIRAALRMLATAGGAPLTPAPTAQPGSLVAIVPVLNERRRLAPALRALCASGDLVAEIVVVDGGSNDGTRELVAACAAGDRRIRLVDAPPAPAGWNGKAWNLAVGVRATASEWIATIDADVRVGPGLLGAAVARAERDGLAALSVATRQELAGLGAALLHPALLTTLVYRAGLPNVATGDPARVQANGQVFVARRRRLVAADAIARARGSRCEDVTIARVLTAAGDRVGFYEGDAVVRMHESWRDCAANWPRSLTLRDAFVPAPKLAAALLELLFAQALPLPTLVLLLAFGRRAPFGGVATACAGALVLMRLGVLAGTRRAYLRPGFTYWLSPLADLPAVALLIASALKRTHVWRGRVLVDEAAA